jgi:putative acetyltransferase
MTTATYDIREDDLSGDPTRELLRLHLQGMHANSPPGHVFALDLSGLTEPPICQALPSRA